MKMMMKIMMFLSVNFAGQIELRVLLQLVDRWFGIQETKGILLMMIIEGKKKIEVG